MAAEIGHPRPRDRQAPPRVMPCHWFLLMLGLLLAGFSPARTATNDDYDGFNRLVKRGTGIAIVYDAEGNRVSKTVSGTTTHYLVDDRNPTGLVSRPPRVS